MNRTLRAIIGAILVLVITLSAVSICQNIGKWMKVDITEQRLYTLSKGTKAILGKLNQPITAKLFYAKTAALKGPDQIRFFNNYYQFVRALLEEYVAASKGMVNLQVIDPRPFSEDEAEAMRYDLQDFPITQEEKFFFGLVVQTQFGVDKVIKFFSPDRQNFVEYDISYLIDTAITRQKRKIGVLSSIGVMGDDMSGYMAQMMRMQGQQPKGPWTIVEQLRKQYEVNRVPTDVNDINDVDILLVIHPKNLPEQTLFAIDQFVLEGGRTIVCVDPHCLVDRPSQPRNPMMPQQQSQKSDLNILMRNWGVEMPQNTIAGDLNLALAARMGEDGVVGFLGLRPGCFNKDSVVTAELNQVTVLFAGVLNEAGESMDPNVPALEVERTPLVTTTTAGNTLKVDSPYELMFMDPGILRRKFSPGVKPVTMGYLLTGRFRSSFPNGIAIEVPVEADEASGESDDEDDEDKTTTKLITGLTEAAEDCAVVVFSDVDFLSDNVAYRPSFFGSKMVVGDNSALLLNTIDDLSGSSDLVTIRSRGNFRRPFGVVDAIEKEAEEKTAEKMRGIEAAILGYNAELQKMVSSAKEGDEEVLGNAILKQRRNLEQRIYNAERQKRVIRMESREGIDGLGRKLQRRNTLMVPAAILIVAIVLGLRRNTRRRHYISHASDA